MIVINNPKEYPLVMDGSKHNGELTGEQLISTGAVMYIGRTGISWGYKDPLWDYYCDLCRTAGIKRAGYHVIYPSQPAGKQIENVKRIVGDDPGDCLVPVWTDLELDQGVPANQIADCVQEFGEGMQRAFGGEKGNYSRTSWIEQFMPNQGWLDDYWWWMAQYLNSGNEHPGPYTVPAGLDQNRIVMMQTTHKGQIVGHQGDVDFSRWIAGLDLLNVFLGVDETPAEPEPDPDPQPPAETWEQSVERRLMACEDRLDALEDG